MIELSAGPDHRRDAAAGRRRAGLGVLLVIVVGAGLAGAAIERYLMMRRLGSVAGLVMGGPHSAADAHRLAGRLADQIDLNPEQQSQVEAIISRRLAQVGTVREQASAQVLAVIVGAQAEIDSVLTPEQRVKFLDMRRRKGLVDSAGRPILPTFRP